MYHNLVVSGSTPTTAYLLNMSDSRSESRCPNCPDSQDLASDRANTDASVSDFKSPTQVVIAEAALLCGLTKKDAIRLATLLSALVSCIAAIIVVIVKYV